MGVLGLPRIHLRETSSTNDIARGLASGGAAHGVLVTAGAQTHGRGRQGRTWSAPAGEGLLMSLILRNPPSLLPLAAGLAVADAVAKFGIDATLKWPNDVLADGRKLAGILAEGRPQEGWAIVGIGLNVAVDPNDLPTEIRQTSSTMGLPSSSIDTVLESVVACIAERISQSDSEILGAFRSRDALLGRQVSWSGGVGVGAGIDGTGRLIVTGIDGSRHILDAGEVHLGGGV